LKTGLINEDYLFLQGGGEMGALTREYDWSQTSLGIPSTWPQSLRTSMALMLSSTFPMVLFWGEECIQFYNDAFHNSLDFETGQALFIRLWRKYVHQKRPACMKNNKLQFIEMESW
jgi:hypothetical protein